MIKLEIVKYLIEVFIMPDITAPSREDKLQWIRDMGIDIAKKCPENFGLNKHSEYLCKNWKIDCDDCWIKSLED